MADARQVTIDQMLATESYGQVLIAPAGGKVIVERRGPYETGSRFSYGNMTRRVTSRVMLLDLRSPRKLVPAFRQEDGAGYWAGDFSPSGTRATVLRLQDDKLRLGILNIATGTVRWLPGAPDLPISRPAPVWLDDRRFVYVRFVEDRLPTILDVGGIVQRIMPARWHDAARGQRPAADLASTRSVRQNRYERRELVIANATTGEEHTVLTGEVPTTSSGRPPTLPLRRVEMTDTQAFICATAGSSGSLDAIGRAAAIMGARELGNCGNEPQPSRIWATDPAALSIERESLLVIVCGELRCSDRPALETALRRATSAVQVAERLSGQAWGSYVAFIREGNRFFVFRDPSGATPLYVARSLNSQIASTTLTPALLAAAGHRARIHEPNVAKLLASPPAPAFLSSLEGVDIVTAGELVGVNLPAQRHKIWSPGEIASRKAPLAPEQLVDTLDQVLAELAGDSRIGVELSGGLDSSIVCTSLAQLGLDPKPFNVATSGKGGDETPFANDVAAHAGVALHRFKSDSALPDYSSFEGLAHPRNHRFRGSRRG
ncbi:asparagine synthase-related protein [Sphingomonas koreensis]|nr:asparagine synthase-related protein [Sphingomonas koreensis]